MYNNVSGSRMDGRLYKDQLGSCSLDFTFESISQLSRNGTQLQTVSPTASLRAKKMRNSTFYVQHKVPAPFRESLEDGNVSFENIS
jgi:hypothetical protein